MTFLRALRMMRMSNCGGDCLLSWMGAAEVMDSERSIQMNSHPRGKSSHLGCLLHRDCVVRDCGSQEIFLVCVYVVEHTLQEGWHV